MIQLSDHFTFQKLLRFSLPAICMLVFISVYGVVDGFFVSNYVGKTAFTAVNFIMPFLMILGCVGFMFGTGGSALIAKLIGEGDRQKANSVFSMIIFLSVGVGIVLSVLGQIFIRPLAFALGAEGPMLEDALTYGRVILLAIPGYIVQFEFQCFFTTAEKPKLGLYTTLISGCTNIVLDALFVAVFSWGLTGAAAATAISQYIGGILPILYFGRKNTSLLRIAKPSFDGKAIFKVCTNGSSELMSNISMSIVSMLYNVQLLKYAGEDGIAAYGVLMYVSLVFQAIFIGFSIGSAPIVSYNFGAENTKELKNVLKKGLILISVFAACMFAFAEMMAKPLSHIFVGYDKQLMQMTLRGFMIYSFGFLCSGFAIYGSSFFTALNNGLVSALISFLRTLVFQILSVLLFPLLMHLDGIWFSIVFAEIMAMTTTFFFLLLMRKKYQY